MNYYKSSIVQLSWTARGPVRRRPNTPCCYRPASGSVFTTKQDLNGLSAINYNFYCAGESSVH